MGVTAIVLAAGKGSRLRSKISKPLTRILNRPLIAYSLSEFQRSKDIAEIIIVCNNGNRLELEKIVKKYRFSKVRGIVEGGKRRQDSVLNGLLHIDSSSEIVLIHDSARPFIDGSIIKNSVSLARRFGASVVAVPVKYTVKESSKDTGKTFFYVKKTLARENIWEIQTPQVFKTEWLKTGLARFNDIDITDDSGFVERLKKKVYLSMGSYYNIKVTTPEDIVIAQAIAGKLKKRGP